MGEGLIKIRQSVISPVNAANLRSKLLQIASGVIIGEDGSHRLAIQNRMAILWGSNRNVRLQSNCSA